MRRFAVLFPTVSSAQINTGKISGFVNDTGGGVVPGAVVRAISDSNRRRRCQRELRLHRRSPRPRAAGYSGSGAAPWFYQP